MKPVTVSLSVKELDALSEILDLAYSDQEDYMSVGNPHTDYGNEWPDTAREKAKRFRVMAKLVKKIGLISAKSMWESLAEQMEASAKEYEDSQRVPPSWIERKDE